MEKEEYLDLYYQMVLIRLVEEAAAQLYQQGKIGGFLHLYIGQEAVSTGLISARKPQDRVITAYRDHGVAINCGLPANQVIAELLGKSTGVSKGKGGSMHMADVSKNYWGGHSIVGAHLPIATGLALGDQYQKNDGVTICMFGDGASNIGYFHEALNLSKVWKLPVLWVCENNQYGMGTAVERASAVSEIRQKAEGYCIPMIVRMAWMCSKCARPLKRPSPLCVPATAPSSWRSRPIASAGIRWVTQSVTASPRKYANGRKTTRSAFIGGG
jgi:pyruvate dehydrogenase E1 component alpha subunit